MIHHKKLKYGVRPVMHKFLSQSVLHTINCIHTYKYTSACRFLSLIYVSSKECLNALEYLLGVY